ncbi:hypothetical protein LINPERHAP1_LOCUS36956, partial [Linum perenne]
MLTRQPRLALEVQLDWCSEALVVVSSLQKWTLRMGQSILRHLVCDPFDGATRLVLRDHGSSVVGTTYLGIIDLFVLELLAC